MRRSKLFEDVATRICGKRASISGDECFETRNGFRYICRDKCRVDEKSTSQLEYVKSSLNDNIFLKACPGSGKTEVVAFKTAYELNNWNQLGGIAVLSFTQNAVSVITNRVKEFIGIRKVSYPHYIGTIDSWLHSYIAHPFSHHITEYVGKEKDKSIRLVDSLSDAGFLNSYSTQYSFARTGTIKGHQYYWDFQNDCAVFSSQNRPIDEARKKKFREDEEWKRANLNRELSDLKWKFWKDGFATYQDIEYLSYLLISENKDFCDIISKRFPFIIIDECQDLSWIQLSLLQHLKDSGSRLHFVGDPNQAIYEFKKVDPLKVLDFVKKNQFITKKININFRSNQVIVDLCQNLVSETKVIADKKIKLNKSCLCINYKKNDIRKLVHWFEDKLRRESLPVERSAVVARGWSTVQKLRPSGNNSLKNIQEKIAAALFLWNTENMYGRREALSYIGAFVSNRFFFNYNVGKYNYYCPEVISSPLKWRLFLARVLDECREIQWDLNDLSNTWTVWAKKIRINIHLILEKHKNILKYFNEDFKQCQFRALSGKSSEKVIDTIKDKFTGEHSNLRTTTIHQVKGETLDAIMVVSSPDKRGNTKDGHWSFWLEDPKSEKARLAYVASSRPKHLLVWAVPDLARSEKIHLSKIGFSVINL